MTLKTPLYKKSLQNCSSNYNKNMSKQLYTNNQKSKEKVKRIMSLCEMDMDIIFVKFALTFINIEFLQYIRDILGGTITK